MDFGAMINFLRIVAAFALLSFAGAAHAQTGQLQAGQTWGNPTAFKGLPKGTTVGALIDRSLSCTAQGDIIYRGVSLWTCLAPGTAGLPLVSGGAGANLVYSTLANAALTNSAVTVNGTTCTLGSTCSPSASSLVVGTTSITGGTTTNILYNNGGLLGERGVATSAEFLAGTSNKIVQAGVIYPAETTTTYGTTTTFDFSTFKNTKVTLTGNITTQTLTNVMEGKSGTITFIQDGSGLHTTVWSSTFKFAGGTAPVLTTTAAAVDILSYSCRTTTFCEAALMNDVK